MGNRLLDELEGAVDVVQRLQEVNDVDAVALREDEALHLRVPTTGLVTEVDAALKQLPHRDDGHGRAPRCYARLWRFRHCRVGLGFVRGGQVTATPDTPNVPSRYGLGGRNHVRLGGPSGTRTWR